MSFPSNANGIAFAWTNVGCAKFSFAIPCSSRGSRPKEANDDSGSKYVAATLAGGAVAALSSAPSCSCFRFIVTEVDRKSGCFRRFVEKVMEFSRIGLGGT